MNMVKGRFADGAGGFSKSGEPDPATALKMMHGPAHLAGLGALHDFLERGFEAFRSMGDAETFLDAVVQRESAILRALFSGRSDPFDVTREHLP